MEIAISLLMGYCFGMISPSALISKIKKKNLSESGTKNLGATNTMLVCGKLCGAIVMGIDILKGFLSVKLSTMLFPKFAVAGLLAGCGAVVGHIFPVYLKFKGGKGFAAFVGMILALAPNMFVPLMLSGILLVLITDYAVAMPILTASVSPYLFGYYFKSLPVFGIMLAVCALILFKHRENVRRIKSNSEMGIREYINSRKK